MSTTSYEEQEPLQIMPILYSVSQDKLCLSTNDENAALMSVHKNISQNAEFSDKEILRI